MEEPKLMPLSIFVSFIECISLFLSLYLSGRDIVLGGSWKSHKHAGEPECLSFPIPVHFP